MSEEIKVLNYEPLEKSVARLSEGTVHYEVEPDWAGGCETEAEATLYWDENQHRWLAKVSGKYLEGYEQGAQLFLDFSHNPQALNDSACRKLLEVYKVDLSRPDLQSLQSLDPRQLEALARSGE